MKSAKPSPTRRLGPSETLKAARQKKPNHINSNSVIIPPCLTEKKNNPARNTSQRNRIHLSMKAMTPANQIPLQVRVVDQRAATRTETATRAAIESVDPLLQIPDHSGCPPPQQYQTIGAAVAGAIMTTAAWFRETLFPAWSARKKDWDEYKNKVDTLMTVHNKEEQDKLITARVREELALTLKQRATENH